MAFFNTPPDITVDEVAVKLQGRSDFVLLDVREYAEKKYAQIIDERIYHLPLSLLARQGLDALPEDIKRKDREIIVFCHHGARSSQVVSWLKSNGWQNVFNMRGGIDAYAHFVDPAVGSY